MDRKVHLTTSVKFGSREEAKIVFEAIFPEIQDHSFDRSQVSMVVETNEIRITITSNDIPAAKANINAILRWISVVNESIQLIPKKIVKTKAKK